VRRARSVLAGDVCWRRVFHPAFTTCCDRGLAHAYSLQSDVIMRAWRTLVEPNHRSHVHICDCYEGISPEYGTNAAETMLRRDVVQGASRCGHRRCPCVLAVFICRTSGAEPIAAGDCRGSWWRLRAHLGHRAGAATVPDRVKTRTEHGMVERADPGIHRRQVLRRGAPWCTLIASRLTTARVLDILSSPSLSAQPRLFHIRCGPTRRTRPW
jgi:hypothetical protein